MAVSGFTHQEIASWFAAKGVPIGDTDDAVHKRLDAIFQDIIHGRRTVEQVKFGINQIATGKWSNHGKPKQVYKPPSVDLPWGMGTATVDEGGITVTPEPPNTAAEETAEKALEAQQQGIVEEDEFTSERGDASKEVEQFLADFFTPEQVRLLMEEVIEPALVLGESDVEIITRIRKSQPYLDRFPAMAMRADNKFNAISEQEYLELEDAYKGILQRTGMPKTFYDSPDDFHNFIANNVAPSVLEDRVVSGFNAAQSAPQEVKDALSQFYGVGNTTAALAAYYLDPEKGLDAIKREFETAQIEGAARTTGFGGIGLSEAERLQSLGVSESEARQGFSNLAQTQEIFRAGIGEVGGTNFSRGQQVDAAFDQDAVLLEKVRKQRERRLAGFAGANSGGVLNQSGASGLRSSNT